MLRTGLSFTLTPKSRMDCCGWMNVRRDVVIADQAESQRSARRLAVADRRAHSRVGDRHDNVGFDQRLGGEDAPEIRPHLVDAAAEDVAVGTREVDVLEDTVCELRRRIGANRAQAAVADDQQLAGLDVADVGGADQIQGAGFREQTIQASPSWPSASGRKPCGSRAAISRFLVSRTIENAPLTCEIDSTSASSTVGAFERAYKWRTTSVSLVVWKIDPLAPARRAARAR